MLSKYMISLKFTRGIYCRADKFVWSHCRNGFSTSVTVKLNFGTTESETRLSVKQVKPFKDIPGPRGLPFFGTLFSYKYGRYSRHTYHEGLLENFHKYGDIFKETIAGQTRVHLFNPDYITVMYGQEGKIPHIPPLLETTQLYRKSRDMSPGLGNTNGDEWYRLRSAVQQMMMRPKAVSMFLPLVNEVLDDMITYLHRVRDPSTGQTPDFRNDLLKWSLESSAYTCFERRLGCIEAGPNSLPQQLLDANSQIFDLSLKLRFGIPWFKLVSTPKWKQLLVAEDMFFGFGQKLVDETVSKLRSLIEAGSLEEGQYGFLSYLIGRDELTYKDLSIITLSLFADGLSTTIPSLIGQIYCLASNPLEQQRLYEHIQQVAPHRDQPITNEMLSRLPYLKACIKEGFRFFPIGTEVSRIPQRDMVVGGYSIPAGTHVELNNNMLLRLPQYFEDPEAYRPERWVRGKESAENVHPYLLLPFGFGPRTCAGRRFAEQELQLMLVRLLQNFTIEWPHKEKMKQKYCMLLQPNRAPNFKFIPRT